MSEPKENIPSSIQNTLDKLAEVREYVTEHKSRFRLVLSTKKAAYLENALEQSRWTLNHSLNSNEETTFSKLPWEQQEEQLERLNKTFAFVLAGDDVTGKDKKIHLRCRALYNSMKNFQNSLA